jgi:hypothetical protein
LVTIVTVYVRLGFRRIVGALRCGDGRAAGRRTVRQPAEDALGATLPVVAVVVAAAVALLVELLPQPATAKTTNASPIDPPDEKPFRIASR